MTTTLDAFNRSGRLVYGSAPTVRRRIPGTRLWQSWTGTGWADSAPAAAPATVTAPSSVTVRWVEPEIVPEAPRMPQDGRGYMRPRGVLRPYDPDGIGRICLHGHADEWRRNGRGFLECCRCRASEGRRYRARLAERGG